MFPIEISYGAYGIKLLNNMNFDFIKKDKNILNPDFFSFFSGIDSTNLNKSESIWANPTQSEPIRASLNQTDQNRTNPS